MITSIVQIKLPAAITQEKASELFSASCKHYLNIQGLIRKYYLISEDGLTAGGVYLWKSKRDAESFLNKEWSDFIIKKYGNAPVVAYFHSPVIVDSLAGTITTNP